MKITIQIIIAILLMGCSTSKQFYEAKMPFKNYATFNSQLVPLKIIPSKQIIRLWLFESTSIDRLLFIYLDYENKYRSELVEFGKTHKGKVTKEIYNVTNVEPKNEFENLFKKIEKFNIYQLKDLTNAEIAIHEPVINYIVEVKNGKSQNIFQISIPESDDNASENFHIDLIKFLKAEFGLN